MLRKYQFLKERKEIAGDMESRCLKRGNTLRAAETRKNVHYTRRARKRVKCMCPIRYAILGAAKGSVCRKGGQRGP
jgi:hypothetical protein